MRRSGKYFNLNNDDDVEAVLELLDQSDADFCDDDNAADETWVPLDVDSGEKESNESFDNADIFESTNEDPTRATELSNSTGPPTTTQQSSICQHKERIRRDIWKSISFPNIELPTTLGCQQNIVIKSPLEYFNRYFPETHYEDVVKYTKMYVMSKRGQEVRYVPSDIKRFYGCVIVMGCLGYPAIRMYWSHECKIPAIFNSMSRDKFLELRSDIHFSDYSAPDSTNKLWRIQSVINMVRERCNELATEVTNYSIDEQMIPFTGRSPARQVIRSKPRPVGLKNLVCATSDGMVVDFEVFQGAGTFKDCGLGHGPSIVIRLTKNLPKNSHIYFDRFFTTIPLLESLHHMGYPAAGTIMANRVPKSVKFPLDKDMNRGDICQFVNENVAVVKWKDTRAVIAASNMCGKDPVGEIERWNKNLKRRCPVQVPAVIKNYNAFMGGVDLCDQMLEYYRIKMKTKKWTVKVFFHFLDLALYNSWMEYRKQCKLVGLPKAKVKSLLTFKMELGTVLASSFEVPAHIERFQLSKDFSGTKYRPRDAPDDIRFDRYDHWPEFSDDPPRVCRNNCGSRSRTRCQKCKVTLCLAKNKDCFEKYHSKS